MYNTYKHTLNVGVDKPHQRRNEVQQPEQILAVPIAVGGVKIVREISVCCNSCCSIGDETGVSSVLNRRGRISGVTGAIVGSCCALSGDMFAPGIAGIGNEGGGGVSAIAFVCGAASSWRNRLGRRDRTVDVVGSGAGSCCIGVSGAISAAVIADAWSGAGEASGSGVSTLDVTSDSRILLGRRDRATGVIIALNRVNTSCNLQGIRNAQNPAFFPHGILRVWGRGQTPILYDQILSDSQNKHHCC